MKQLFTYCSLLIYLTGCVATHLDPYTSPEPVERLKLLETHHTTVTIDPMVSAAMESPLGHQYLLFVLPFGNIYLSLPSDHIKHSIETALVELAPQYRRNLHEIHVSSALATITAYDLFFMRRVVCTVTITLDNGIAGFGSESLWHPMPFKVVLERALNKATLSAAREIISSSANSH